MIDSSIQAKNHFLSFHESTDKLVRPSFSGHETSLPLFQTPLDSDIEEICMQSLTLETIKANQFDRMWEINELEIKRHVVNQQKSQQIN